MFFHVNPQIAVSDNGIPQLTSTTRVVIQVEDMNDNSPEFDQRFYKIQIPATAKIDQPLFQVSDFQYKTVLVDFLLMYILR